MAKKKEQPVQQVLCKWTDKQVLAWWYLLDTQSSEILFGGGAGSGKAQPMYSMVSTMYGFKAMSSVTVGDMISHPDGYNTRVIAIHPQGKKDIYTVTFTDGTSTQCSTEHLWQIRKNGKISKQEAKRGEAESIWTSEQMYDYYENLKEGSRYTLSIPLAKPVQYTVRNKFFIDPYVLGFLIGDGGLTNNVTYTTADKEINTYIQQRLPKGYSVNDVMSQKYGYSITDDDNTRTTKGYFKKNLIKAELDKLGLMFKRSEKKFIPKKYLFSTINDRYNLLSGLLDSDGTVDKDGGISYSTSSKQLAYDVQHLVESLGGRATITVHPSSYKDKKGNIIKCLNSYNLYIRIHSPEKCFKLKRKLSRLVPNKYPLRRTIQKIEKAGKTECQCITVSAPDGLYLTDHFIVTHNSYLGCAWLINNCFAYPGTRWLMGRSKLSDLKKTTLKTFFDVLTEWGIKPELYNYNQQENIISFPSTGSEIMLKDLFQYPSDFNFDSLGSLELTGAFIDEVNMISEKAKNIVASRIRYKLEQNNLSPKLLMTCNPSKGFIYDQYYRPSQSGTLPKHRKFVQSLVTDNEFISPHYKEQLSRLDEISKRRLLYGEWEYENNLALFNYDSILGMFNTEIEPEGESYLSIDVARLGKDKTVILIWKGQTVTHIETIDKSTIDQLLTRVTQLRQLHNISTKNTIVDSDGVGGGLADFIPGCVSFVNNSRALNGENFSNMKSQVYYKLAEIVNSGLVHFNCEIDTDVKEKIIQELEMVSAHNVDRDGKLQITPKPDIKSQIGRSPDYSDALAMKMYYHLNHTSKITGEYFIRVGSMIKR